MPYLIAAGVVLAWVYWATRPAKEMDWSEMVTRLRALTAKESA